MADVLEHGDSRGGVVDPDDVRILDDCDASDPVSYRRGDKVDVYHRGKSVKFVVTEIVERDGRRISYGIPA